MTAPHPSSGGLTSVWCSWLIHAKGERNVQEIRVLIMLTTFNIKERNKNPVSHNSPLFITPPYNSVPTLYWNLDWLDLAWAARGAVNPCVPWPCHIPKELFHFPISRLYRPSVPLPNGPRALAREAWYWYPFVTGHSWLTSCLPRQTHWWGLGAALVCGHSDMNLEDSVMSVY